MPNGHLFETVAGYLRSELFPDISLLSQRVLLGLYRLIAQGSPVAMSDLCGALVINSNTARGVLEAVGPSRLQYDAEGRIIAFAGLSQAPTPHRFLFDGFELYTWCAFDSLFLPHLLNGEARVSSICPVTNATIQLTVTPKGPRDMDPGSTVMSFVMPTAEKHCGDLRGAFCNHVNFLASREEANIWQERNLDAAIFSVTEAFKLGRMRNEACFGEVFSAERRRTVIKAAAAPI